MEMVENSTQLIELATKALSDIEKNLDVHIKELQIENDFLKKQV